MRATGFTADLARWRNAVFALFLVNGVTSASWFARIPSVRNDIHADLSLMGVVLLCGAIGSILGLAAAPALLAHFGAQPALRITVTFYLLSLVLASLGASLWGSLPVVAIGIFAWGVGIGSSDVIVNIEAAAVETQAGKTLMPLMHAFYSFGTVLGALLGTLTAALALPIIVHMGIALIPCAGLAVWAIARVPHELAAPDAPQQPEHWRNRMRSQWQVWRDPVVLLIGLGVLANGLAEGGAGDWMAIGAVDGHGLTEAFGAFLFGMFVAGMTLMRVIGGPLVDRWGRVVTLRISASTALIGVALFVWVNQPWALVLASVLWGMGVALGFPLGMSAAADDPRGPARVGAVSIIGYGAFLIGPPLLGLLGQHLGILRALLVLLPLLALAVLVSPAARERSGPHAADDQGHPGV